MRRPNLAAKLSDMPPDFYLFISNLGMPLLTRNARLDQNIKFCNLIVSIRLVPMLLYPCYLIFKNMSSSSPERYFNYNYRAESLSRKVDMFSSKRLHDNYGCTPLSEILCDRTSSRDGLFADRSGTVGRSSRGEVTQSKKQDSYYRQWEAYNEFEVQKLDRGPIACLEMKGISLYITSSGQNDNPSPRKAQI